jgi:hypothetical protein
MLIDDKLCNPFLRLSNDARITVWHLSIYIAIFLRWREKGCNNWVRITRKEIMKSAHIGSTATYHKCLKQLKDFGYFDYFPSYDPSLGSQILLHV